jgi:hypothetical protein
LARPGVRGTFSQTGPSRPTAAVRLARTLGRISPPPLYSNDFMRIPSLSAFIFAVLISGCTSLQTDSMVIRAGADMRCMQQDAVDATNTKYTTRWCTSRQIFQPNRHIVKVNGQTVFDGNDRDDVRAEVSLTGSKVSATCTPRIEIMDLKSDGPVAISSLPKELIESCRIVADAAGLHRPFLRDEQCSKVYSAVVGPMVGKTLPFKRTQECKAEIGALTIFKGTFVYQ